MLHDVYNTGAGDLVFNIQRAHNTVSNMMDQAVIRNTPDEIICFISVNHHCYHGDINSKQSSLAHVNQNPPWNEQENLANLILLGRGNL